MNIYPQIKARLTSYSAVSSKVANRVYPDVLPQNPTDPAITYQQIGQPRASEGSAELFWLRYQIDCYAPKYVDVSALADAVQTSFRGWGNLSGQPKILQTLDSGRLDDYEDEVDVRRIMLDFEFLVCDE